jgi:hypothetical protein
MPLAAQQIKGREWASFLAFFAGNRVFLKIFPLFAAKPAKPVQKIQFFT